jgi:hypothetical protein
VPRPSRDYERAALATGTFRVDAQGGVWRVRHYGKPCAPSRADGLQGDGYRSVYLRLGGRRTRVLAHRLVWVALRGPIPPGLVVRHRSQDRGDNRPENLILARPSVPLRGAATGAAAATGVSGRTGVSDV